MHKPKHPCPTTPVTDRCLHDGPSCTTILVVRDPVFKDLSKFSECPTTDRHTHDGPSCTTIMIVRDPSDKGLPTFSKCPMTDRRTDDGPSCTIVMMVRDPSDKGLPTFSKCPTTDSYDGPSYRRRSVLLDRHDGQRPLLQGSFYVHRLCTTRWTS